MSREKMDLVRSIYAAWGRGDFAVADWADPEIEYVSVDGPDPGSYKGLAEMSTQFRTWLTMFEEFRLEADEYREVDAERVLVLDRYCGRWKTSGLDVGQLHSRGAWLFHVRDGKVTRMERYIEADHALESVGLTE